MCRGGGQEVAHSSEFAKPQGSSAVTCSAFFQVQHDHELGRRDDGERQPEAAGCLRGTPGFGVRGPVDRAPGNS